MSVFLRRWWTKKYSLPSTHNLYQEASEFELLTEFYEDYYEENHSAQLDLYKDENGEVQLIGTGDALIDKWERELAMGLEPDLNEGLSTEQRQELVKEQNKPKRSYLDSELDGFTLGSPTKNKKYDSKFAVPGSKEEAALLGSKSSPKNTYRKR